jgi:hypothetical protein
MSLWDKAKDVVNQATAPAKYVSKKAEDVGQYIGGKIGGETGEQVGGYLTKMPIVFRPAEYAYNQLFGGKGGSEAPQGTIPEVYYSEEAKAQEDELKKLQGEFESGERDLRTSLLQQTVAINKAVDEQLKNLLGSTGMAATQSRNMVGQAAAMQGSLRSGITGKNLASVTQREGLAKQELQQKAWEQKYAAQQQAKDVQQQVVDQRTSILNQLRDMQLKGASSAQFQADYDRVKQDYDRFITDLKISADKKQALAGILGGVGQLVGLGVGTSMGGQS